MPYRVILMPVVAAALLSGCGAPDGSPAADPSGAAEANCLDRIEDETGLDGAVVQSIQPSDSGSVAFISAPGSEDLWVCEADADGGVQNTYTKPG